MTDNFTKEQRSRIMSAIRQTGTNIERSCEQILRELRIPFSRNSKLLIGKPDFVIKKYKLVIFVHGCFWHGHAKCNRGQHTKSNTDYWAEKIANNKKRDERVVRQLKKDGWHVLVLWQCNIQNTSRVKNKIIKAIS